MDAGEGLPGRWGPARPAPQPLGTRPARPGRRGGRIAAAGGAGRTGVRGEAGADLTVRCWRVSALFPSTRSARWPARQAQAGSNEQGQCGARGGGRGHRTRRGLGPRRFPKSRL